MFELVLFDIVALETIDVVLVDTTTVELTDDAAWDVEFVDCDVEVEVLVEDELEAVEDDTFAEVVEKVVVDVVVDEDDV